jgi:hypothetical protein
MKSRWITVFLCIVAAVILIVRLVPHGRGPHPSGASSAPRAHRANAFAGLRTMALQSTRANFGLGAASAPDQPFVVLADWGDARGATTIVAVADGSASVYSSDGAGSIGGGQTHPTIHDAALRTVELAAAALPQAHPATAYPVAAQGQVTFYLVTDAGVYTATAAQDDLNANRSPLSALAASTQKIVAEYRRFDGR